MDEFVRPGKDPFKRGNLDGLLPSKNAAKPKADELPAPTPPEAAPKSIFGTSPTIQDNELPDTIPPGFDPTDEPLTAKGDNGADKAPKKRRLRFPKLKWWQWLIVAFAALLLIGGAGAGWWFFIRKKPVKYVAPVVVVEKKKVEPPKPTTEPSKLSGLPVGFDVNKRPVTAVMIENSPDARPQAGLKEASVVFEAVAEGGITRFNALFQDTAPDYIGPVRSVRPYYIDWFWPFDASIAHAGGSPQGLADVKSLKIKDLDQFANSGAYNRVSTRFAPHNLYTSISKLNDLEKAKGFTTSTFTGFPRKAEKQLKTPTAKGIDIDISSFYYNVHYDYNATYNNYFRSEGGKPHNDDKTGTQLSPKVVVVVVMQRGIANDGQHTNYQTTGSGKVYVYQDGGLTEGTWYKTGRQDQWKFTDAAGATINFNPGQTWITMVDTPGSVTTK